MKTLYVIHHSPWSERARWALLHHELAFVEREHVPLVGELSLRFRTKAKGKATVPLLVDADGTTVQGSLAIAEHADQRGSRPTLFPPGKAAEIKTLFDDFEECLNAARERFMRDLLNDRDAQLESLPSLLRRLPFAAMSARIGTSFVRSKYDATKGSIDERIRAGLERVRDLVGKKKYVLGEFSFADILCASVVQTVDPVSDKWLVLPPATRRLWTDTSVAKDYADIVSWRDRIYEAHRPRVATKAAG